MNVEELQQRLDAKDAELQEFTRESKEYEAELEREISQLETVSNKHQTRIATLESDLARVNEKAKQDTRQLGSQMDQIIQMQQEREVLSNTMNNRIRELEQHNDDLERAERYI